MRKIPPPLRDKLANDKWYKKCCLSPETCKISNLGTCGGRIEWHHNLIYAGKQVNEPFCILPVCHNHHYKAQNKTVKEVMDLIMWSRATSQQIGEYSKSVDYKNYFKYLKEKYL